MIRSPEKIKRYVGLLTRLANLVRQTRTPAGVQAFKEQAPQIIKQLREIPDEYGIRDALWYIQHHYNDLVGDKPRSAYNYTQQGVRERLIAHLNSVGKLLQTSLYSPRKQQTVWRNLRLHSRAERALGRARLDPPFPYEMRAQQLAEISAQLGHERERIPDEQARADREFLNWAQRVAQVVRKLQSAISDSGAPFREVTKPSWGGPNAPTRVREPNLRYVQYRQEKLRKDSELLKALYRDMPASVGRSPIFWASGAAQLRYLIDDLESAISLAYQPKFNSTVSAIAALVNRILKYRPR